MGQRSTSQRDSNPKHATSYIFLIFSQLSTALPCSGTQNLNTIHQSKMGYLQGTVQTLLPWEPLIRVGNFYVVMVILFLCPVFPAVLLINLFSDTQRI